MPTPLPDYRRLVWSLLGGAAIGIVLTLLVVRTLNRDPTPLLTPAAFQAAREQWRQQGPLNYEIEVQVSGSQAATYRVEVRGGEAQNAWRNDRPLAQQRTFGTWSVPGMFSTMSRDVDHLQRHAEGRADATTPRLTLRAEFDPKFGFPQRYTRIEWGSDVEVSWEVKRFEVAE